VTRKVYGFGDFRLDLGQRRLEGLGGDAVALTAKPFDALVHLVEIDQDTIVAAGLSITIVIFGPFGCSLNSDDCGRATRPVTGA